MRIQRFFLLSVILVSFALRLDATLFQQAYVKASNCESNDNFGWKIALSGNTMVVAAPYEGSSAVGVNGDSGDNGRHNAGAVYVFVRNGTLWSQQAYLKASNTDSNDTFGYSVALSGDTIVVGAPQEGSSATGVNGNQANNSSTNSGAAYVFVRNGSNWTQQAYLKASNTGTNDFFGYSVAISGDTIVVGAVNESSASTGVNNNGGDNSSTNSGAAYVFTRTGTNWSQQAYLKASNTGSLDNFGWSVAASGDTVAVGAYQEDSSTTGVNGPQFDNSATNSGAVYVFVRTGTNWNQQAYLKASNTDAEDIFGESLSLDSETLVVGAPAEASGSVGVNGNAFTNNAPTAGAAYVFVRNGTAWSQQAYIKASNTQTNQYFGFDVSVRGDNLVIGAPLESSSSTGINSNQTNTAASFAGAAYSFRRNGTTWSQSAYIKASNTDAGDLFGVSVAVSGTSIAVAAHNETSGSPGINGNQNDNSAIGAGAVYVYIDLEGSQGPEVSIVPAGYYLRFTGIPGVTYDIQRAPAVTGPWTTIASAVAPQNGFVEYHEVNPPPVTSYYRTLQF